MTRREFVEGVDYWSELLDFCNEQGCSICEEIYDSGGRDDLINELLYDWVRSYGWQDIYNKLDNIPDYGDYFRYDDYGDWDCVDDEFDSYKSDVLAWMDNGGYWDEDDEEVDEEDDDEGEFEEYEEEVSEEDFSLDELFKCCKVDLSTIDTQIQLEKEMQIKEEEDALEEFANGLNELGVTVRICQE